MAPLHRVRKLEKYLSTRDVAYLFKRSGKWVRDHKDMFTHRRKINRDLEYELTSVLEVYWKQEEE